MIKFVSNWFILAFCGGGARGGSQILRLAEDDDEEIILRQKKVFLALRGGILAESLPDTHNPGYYGGTCLALFKGMLQALKQTISLSRSSHS